MQPAADPAGTARPAASPRDDAPVSAKATGVVALAVLCSRILGLIRDQVFAGLFARELRDCFIVAFRTPNMLRDLFAEGALSTAFITVFSQKSKTEGNDSAWLLVHRILSLTVVFMSLVSLGGVLLAPLIIRLLAGGWDDEQWKIPFTVTLAQIMYPFILLVSLAALVMGILNSRRVYGVPAMASSFFNITSIVGGGLLGWLLDPEFGWKAMIGFSIGTLLGGLVQLLVQIPSLYKLGYRFRFVRDWKHPDVRRILRLMWPAMIAGSAVQVNVLLNTIFASHLAEKDGPVSWLNYAFRLMQLPLGMFGVAVATVTLPALSRVAIEGITDGFRSVLGSANRLIVFLTLPSAVGLYLLADPIISLLYERGQFSAYETAATAGALRWYAVGLVFYACIKIVQPAFTAIDRRMVPMFVALGSIVLNAALNSVFVFVLKLGHESLALCTAVIAFTNCSILYFLMSRIAGGLDSARLAGTLARLAVPAALLALIAVAGNRWLLAGWQEFSFLHRCLSLGAVIAAAAVAYFAAATAFRVEEARRFLDIVTARLRR